MSADAARCRALLFTPEAVVDARSTALDSHDEVARFLTTRQGGAERHGVPVQRPVSGAR